MDSSDEDEDEEDDIRWRLRYSRWSIGNDDDDAGAYKAALGRVGPRAKDRCGEPGRDGGRVDVCSLRGTTSTRKLSSEAGKPPPTSRSNALLLSPTISPTSPSFMVPTNANVVHRWLHP